MDSEIAAWPMADETLTQDLLDTLQQLTHLKQGKKGRHVELKQIKKGVNEIMKALNRGLCEIVIMAEDAVPLALLMPLPRLCEDKNVPYVFVPSKRTLGRACGVKRPIIAATIISPNPKSDTANQIKQLRGRVEDLAI